MGSARGGLGIRGGPIAGIGCRIGGDAGERCATDVVAERILKGAKDGGELDLWGVIEGGIGELLFVKVPPVGVVSRLVVWLG